MGNKEHTLPSFLTEFVRNPKIINLSLNDWTSGVFKELDDLDSILANPLLFNEKCDLIKNKEIGNLSSPFGIFRVDFIKKILQWGPNFEEKILFYSQKIPAFGQEYTNSIFELNEDSLKKENGRGKFKI